MKTSLEKLPGRQVWGVVGTLLLAVILTAGACGIMQFVYVAGQTDGTLSVALVEPTPAPPGDAPSSNTSPVVVTRVASPAEASPTQTANPPLPLSGRRIALDPGHGPREDLGAVVLDPDTGKLVLSEDEFNLDVAMRARDILTARGAGVVLTRENAETFTIPWPADVNGDGAVGGYTDDLQARIDVANDFRAEVFLSIHANAGRFNPETKTDLQVIYCGASDCDFPEENKRLGRLVLDYLRTNLDASGSDEYNGELLTDLDADPSDPPLHMFVLGPALPPRHVRALVMPGVLSESLYVSWPEHLTQLRKESVRQAIALAYADALQEYLTGDS
ncbi:MAG: N-acetylmuramoyl-L-alanine amidase [Chloroflexia bacterium]